MKLLASYDIRVVLRERDRDADEKPQPPPKPPTNAQLEELILAGFAAAPYPESGRPVVAVSATRTDR